MILKSFFPSIANGFYVDVGASHTHFISNTQFFYQLGWRGINIDPNPNCMELFRKFRPKDINLELAVSDTEVEQIFYICKLPSLNTFSKEIVKIRTTTQSIEFNTEKKITPVTLSSILDQHLPKNQPIHFFSIDAEGSDLNILKSNNWEKYIPQVIAIESDMNFNIDEIENDEITKYLKDRSYKLIAMTPANLIFVQNSYKTLR